jgi:hypothetical protein
MGKIKIAAVLVLTNFILLRLDNVMADTVTLAVGAGYPATQTYEVPSNTVAQIIYTKLSSSSNPQILVSLPQATNGLPFAYITGSGGAILNPPIIAGPATITLTTTNGLSTTLSICTIQTTPASAASFTPSSSVVIPNDGAGPVTIILESSTDLINWTAANPGTYGTTSSNRFFLS